MTNNENNELFEKYKYLVYKIVKRFNNKYIEYDDLVQAGYMGLLKAIDNAKNMNTFISYASKYIIFEIKEEIKKGSYFKISDYLYKISNKVRQVDSNDFEEIAKICNTSIENVILIKSNNLYTIDKLEDFENISCEFFKMPLGLNAMEEEVLKMRALYRYKEKEIAQTLNISQSNVSRILKNIVEKIS